MMETVDWKEEDSFEDIFNRYVYQETPSFCWKAAPKAIILSTKKYPSRGVGETHQEMVIRGPKDSFYRKYANEYTLIRPSNP